jgi:hypothetical protein
MLDALLRLIIHILTRYKIISKINNISIIHTRRLDLLVIDRYNSYTTFENDFHTPNVQIEQSIDLIHLSAIFASVLKKQPISTVLLTSIIGVKHIYRSNKAMFSHQKFCPFLTIIKLILTKKNIRKFPLKTLSQINLLWSF